MTVSYSSSTTISTSVDLDSLEWHPTDRRIKSCTESTGLHWNSIGDGSLRLGDNSRLLQRSFTRYRSNRAQSRHDRRSRAQNLLQRLALRWILRAFDQVDHGLLYSSCRHASDPGHKIHAYNSDLVFLLYG